MKLIITIALIAAFTAFGYYKFNELTRPLPAPIFDANKYWGPGNGANYKPNAQIKPFQVKYSQNEIDDLRAQLNRPLRLAEPLEGIKFEYGFNTKALQPIIKYWRENYLTKWTEREKYLNSLPQFTTEIQGLRIHYIHAKPSSTALKTKKVIPLLLLHGWPGSVREFYDFIPLLTEAPEMSPYVFEVIAPSLVGFGFSEPATKPGFNAAEMAVVMRNLMLRVGHEKFLIQGGDWGSIIGNVLSTLYPDSVLGYHSNFCVFRTLLSTVKQMIASWYPEKFVPSPKFSDHHFPLMSEFAMLMEESGYYHIQATKPDTIGTVLDDSPIGLAAWILEKFQTFTDGSRSQDFNALASIYGLDTLFDDVMIYYMNKAATSSARFYAENVTKKYVGLQLDRVQSPVPMGCARFKYDVPPLLDWQLKDKFTNVIHSKYYDHGGHFAALEIPKVLYKDFIEFVGKIHFDK